MIAIDRELCADGLPSPQLLQVVLSRFAQQQIRLETLKRTYDLHHDIINRSRLKGLPNNKIVHDLPGYIVAIASGYLTGKPVKYTAPMGQEKAFEALQAAMDVASAESVDSELAKDASVYGKGVELCYADPKSNPRMAQVDPRTAFVVYDSTVEHAPLFGVVLRKKTNSMLEQIGEWITLYTDTMMVGYERVGSETPLLVSQERHYFGWVPLVEYWNNDREMGDFEPVEGLINAYDILQSDRLNDKQQFTDAIFVLKGVGSLGVDDTVEQRYDDEGNVVEATDKQREETDASVRLRQTRMMFLPADGADAGFVTKPDSEGGNEVLRKSLKEDIHKLSFVPDLTDESFAGNVSGVAMKYKLFGLEQLTSVKERWFREGLRQRLRLLSHFLAIRGNAGIDTDRVQITFTRALPVNELEIAQTVNAYDGLVPKKLLLGQVPFVENVDEALKLAQEESAEAIKRQQAAFEGQAFREQAANSKPKETEE